MPPCWSTGFAVLVGAQARFRPRQWVYTHIYRMATIRTPAANCVASRFVDPSDRLLRGLDGASWRRSLGFALLALIATSTWAQNAPVRQLFGRVTPQGVIVEEVRSGSQAFSAGIQ